MADERTSTLDSSLREAASTSYQGHPLGFGSERFELIRELGRGGFGVVYEAVDRGLRGSPAMALKLLRGAHPDRLYRFKREFRSLAEVRHRNLVQLYELVAAGPDVFFTMELIRGESPLEYVRTNPDQVRQLIGQLAEGLMALHRAGKLHRDVKPSNLLVEGGGRVVLLDFGLAIDIDVHQTADRAGTPLYMSPEQCAEQPLQEASDWYAAGTVLFEMLTGRTPFQGSVEELLRAKNSREAPRASAFAEVPDDLDDLCAALLSRDPATRPNGEEVLGRLRTSPPSVEKVLGDPFVGRASEKATLSRLFEQGGRTVVLARGPSGIGKSALLRWFLDEVGRRRPAPLVLAGRCFEIESVPYKALDAVVDELARHLKRLPDIEAAALLPRDANALATLFPVLKQVPAFAQKTARRADDAAELRARGLGALREMFARLSDRQPVVVCIDDLHWGDIDSAALLSELIRSPEPPAVFWLMSFREEEAATSPLLARLTQLRETTLSDVTIVDLPLAGLDGAEAQELAATLLGPGDDDDGARARTIAIESQGNPFFVRELARAPGGDHALGGLVRDRVAQLQGAARQVLEVVAVAAQPLELDVVAASAQVSGELRDALSSLRAEHLIRAREGQNEKLIECYHDRIRVAVVESIAPDRLAAIHLQLAAALESHGASDAAQIGRHLAEGGDAKRALGYLTQAAERAAAALAFEEATQLYRRALELGHRTDALELAYAEVLSAAGHGQEAARIWLAQVDRVGDPQRIDLLRRASEELLLAGEVDQGFATMEALLGALDLSVPRSTAGAMARIAMSRIGQALFGRRLRRRSVPASARELQRVDTLASLAWSVFQLDPLMGYAVQTQHLRLALRSGDRQRAAVALWLEAPVRAMKGSRSVDATRRTLEAAREVTAGLDETRMPAAVFRIVEGIVALLEGRWLDGLRHLETAEEAPNTSVIGHSSLRASIYVMRAMNLFWMGRAGDLLSALPSQLRDMEEHGNLYGQLWLKLLEGWALSCSERLEAAWATSESVRARLPPGVFMLHRWYLEFGQVKYLLLEGKAEAAWQRLEEIGRTIRFTMLGQSQRVSGLWVRANVALGRAVETPALRGAMLAESRKLAQKMERERVPWVDGIARSVRASIALTAGESDEALRLLGEAEPLLEAHHLEAVLAVVRLQRGKLIGGDAGRAAIDLAQAWMTAQRVHPSVARVLLAGAWEA